MLNPIQLSDELNVFNTLTEIFEDASKSGLIEDCTARDEPNGYGSYGYINITINGRRFTVEISEITY